jgi:hypothetical protein
VQACDSVVVVLVVAWHNCHPDFVMEESLDQKISTKTSTMFGKEFPLYWTPLTLNLSQLSSVSKLVALIETPCKTDMVH